MSSATSSLNGRRRSNSSSGGTSRSSSADESRYGAASTAVRHATSCGSVPSSTSPSSGSTRSRYTFVYAPRRSSWNSTRARCPFNDGRSAATSSRNVENSRPSSLTSTNRVFPDRVRSALTSATKTSASAIRLSSPRAPLARRRRLLRPGARGRLALRRRRPRLRPRLRLRLRLRRRPRLRGRLRPRLRRRLRLRLRLRAGRRRLRLRLRLRPRLRARALRPPAGLLRARLLRARLLRARLLRPRRPLRARLLPRARGLAARRGRAPPRLGGRLFLVTGRLVVRADQLLRHADGGGDRDAERRPRDDLLRGRQALVFFVRHGHLPRAYLTRRASSFRVVERLDELRDDPLAKDLGPVRRDVLACGFSGVVRDRQQHLGGGVPARRGGRREDAVRLLRLLLQRASVAVLTRALVVVRERLAHRVRRSGGRSRGRGRLQRGVAGAARKLFLNRLELLLDRVLYLCHSGRPPRTMTTTTGSSRASRRTRTTRTTSSSP